MDKKAKKKSIFSKKSKRDKKDKKDKLLALKLAAADEERRTELASSVQCPKCKTSLKVPAGSMRFLCGQCNTPLSIRTPSDEPLPSKKSTPKWMLPHKSKVQKPLSDLDDARSSVASTNVDTGSNGNRSGDGGGTDSIQSNSLVSRSNDQNVMASARLTASMGAEDLTLEETRRAVIVASRALETVSQVLQSDKGFAAIVDQAAADDSDRTRSVYESIFGIVKSTLLVSLANAHDSFGAQRRELESQAAALRDSKALSISSGSSLAPPSPTARRTTQLLPSDIDPLERQLRMLQKELAEQTAKVERLERTNANFRRTIGTAVGGSEHVRLPPSPRSGETSKSDVAVAPAAPPQPSLDMKQLMDMNDALTQKNEMLLTLLRDGGMVAKPMPNRSGAAASMTATAVADEDDSPAIAHLMRPKINLSLIQRQFEALYQQRVNIHSVENDGLAGGSKFRGRQDSASSVSSQRSQASSSRGQSGTRQGPRTLSSAESVLPKSIFDALTGKVFTKEELSRMSVPVAARGKSDNDKDNWSASKATKVRGGAMKVSKTAAAAAARASTRKPRQTLSRYIPSRRFFDYFAIVAFTPPDLERDWTAQPLVETVQRYPDADHEDFPFETRLAQFACAPASLFSKLGQRASARQTGPHGPSLRQIDGQRVIVHSCVLARAADLADVYVTSLSFLANTSTDVNPRHTDETVYAMCLMSHWPLFSFQAQLLRFLFAHLYEKQVESNVLSPSFDSANPKSTPVFFDSDSPKLTQQKKGGAKMRKKLAQALKQKQTEDMESDLLAYLESVPPPANDSSVNNAEAESAAQAPVTTVTHELIEAVVSELIADGQDVQYLHVRNALRKRLNRLLTASEKDILSTYILQSQDSYERKLAVEAQEAEKAAAKAAAEAAAKPRAVLNPNGSWSILPPQINEEDKRKIIEAEENLRKLKSGARPALDSNTSVEFSPGPLGRGDVRKVAYGRIPMVTLWTSVGKFFDSVSALASGSEYEALGGWRKNRRAAGAPELEDLAGTAFAQPEAVSALPEQPPLPPLEIPLVLDKLWDGMIGAGALTALGFGLFRAGTPILIHEKDRLAALESYVYQLPSSTSARDVGALGRNSMALSAVSSGAAGSAAIGQYHGFSLNVWVIAFWKTLKELPCAPIFGFLEEVSLVPEAEMEQQRKNGFVIPSHSMNTATESASPFVKARALQIFQLLEALDGDDRPTSSILAKIHRVMPALSADAVNLTHRTKSVVLWLFDRLAEIAYASSSHNMAEKLIEYFASALLPSTKSHPSDSRDATAKRQWRRYCQKQLLTCLVEWRRLQLTTTVAKRAQSTFESVLQFQVLVRQLCNDIRVPMDGDLRRLRIMFAPDAKSEAREIPLNLHGMGGPSAKFPVVDQWCYTCLFSCFSVENVITLVRCLATSQSILLLSDNLEMLAPCAEALRSLLYPYPCSHIYIPYLPCEQFMLASTTLPFLMGTLVENFGELEEIEFIAAYVDHDRVVPPSCAMQSYQAFHIQLPLDIHTPLQAALNNAVTLESSNAGADTSNTGILNVAVDVQAVRVAFVGMMRAIIAGLTVADFHSLASSEGSILGAKTGLLISKVSEQRCRFLEIFFNTQHWQLFYEDVVVNPTNSAEGTKIRDLFLVQFNPGFTNPFAEEEHEEPAWLTDKNEGSSTSLVKK